MAAVCRYALIMGRLRVSVGRWIRDVVSGQVEMDVVCK